MIDPSFTILRMSCFNSLKIPPCCSGHVATIVRFDCNTHYYLSIALSHLVPPRTSPSLPTGHHCESFVHGEIYSNLSLPALLQLASDNPTIVYSWTLLHRFDHWVCRCSVCFESSRTSGFVLLTRSASTDNAWYN